jgi:hypothetical protein
MAHPQEVTKESLAGTTLFVVYLFIGCGDRPVVRHTFWRSVRGYALEVVVETKVK